MDSPPPPASPSPSTPTSGDEDYAPEGSFSNTSPVPKRRAVASSTSGGPQHSAARRRGTGGEGNGNTRIGSMNTGQSQGGQGQKEELMDVQYMNELRAIVGDPFDEGDLASKS